MPPYDGTGHKEGKHVTTPMMQLRSVSKYFGSVIALKDVSVQAYPNEVTCILGDNGAGKSTLIKIFSGFHRPDEGELLVNGDPKTFHSPRDARAEGIATVYQDLAMVPLMSIWRNFFLGAEPRKGIWPLRYFDVDTAKQIARDEIGRMGIALRDPDQPVSTLSGGERQSVATARAVYFGARVLILDEPTAALGVRQAGVVLKYIVRARDAGLTVVFITHNPSHAHLVGDRFVLLNRGRSMGEYRRDEITRDELLMKMAGGAELDELSHEISQLKTVLESDDGVTADRATGDGAHGDGARADGAQADGASRSGQSG
jgi:simple sugar transport system ATP-binding protein